VITSPRTGGSWDRIATHILALGRRLETGSGSRATSSPTRRTRSSGSVRRRARPARRSPYRKRDPRLTRPASGAGPRYAGLSPRSGRSGPVGTLTRLFAGHDQVVPELGVERGLQARSGRAPRACGRSQASRSASPMAKVPVAASAAAGGPSSSL